MSDPIDDGGPAFPAKWTNYGESNATAPDNSIVPPGETVELQGMSLRDYFAGQIMVAFVGAGLEAAKVSELHAKNILDDAAASSYVFADEMLKARRT